MSGPLPAEDFDLEEILTGLSRWVEVESPTTDADAVNRAMDLAQDELRELGARVTRHPGNDGFGDTVVGRLPWGGDEPGILVLAHLDTVHPLGALAGPLALRRAGDRLYGPGVFDMKGGAYCALYAAGRVQARDGATPLPVTFMFVPDEEFGSPSTRALIETEAARQRYVLVPEPAQHGGNLITGRWAFQRFVLRARGRPAHAGAEQANGRSAIRELAQQVLAIESLSDPEQDVTLSVGVLHAGRFVNVVPAEGVAEVLAVTPTQESFDEVRERVLGLRPVGREMELEVVPGPARPLWEPDDAGLELYERARALAREVGFDPGHGSVGGGSDGNFTGALGVPTLDGLGVSGGGFHTHDEHLEIGSIVPRTQLLSGLLRTLT